MNSEDWEVNSERLDFEQPSMHFGTFARKMDPRILENGPQYHPKVHLGPCHAQARSQRNLEAKNGPPSRCFLVVTCTIWFCFPFWWRGSDRFAAARLSQVSKPPKIVPKKIHSQEVQTLKNRSQKVHFTEPQTCCVCRHNTCAVCRHNRCPACRHNRCLIIGHRGPRGPNMNPEDPKGN